MDISYNGISFSIVKTNEISNTPIWSEDGTTYLYNSVKIDVEGILNPQAMAYSLDGGGNPIAVPGSLPPVTVAAVRWALEQPRAQLLATFPSGDVLDPTLEVIQSPADGFTCDLNNGPKPGPCTIRSFSGSRTWIIHWTCETWIHECPDEDSLSASDNPLISNRYSQEDTLDVQRKSVRMTRGTAIFRSDILENIGQTADDFRAFVLPPTPLGFFRRRINVTAVPNRNALSWNCEDEERMYDLGDTAATGSFITEVHGTYGVSTVMTNEGIPGGQSLGQLVIRVVGTKQASNWVMTQRAFAIAAAKLPIGSAPPAGGPIPGWIRSVAVNQSLVDRDITVNIVYMFVPPPLAAIGVANLSTDSMRIDSVFPDQGGLNPSPPWGGGTQGTSQLKLLVAALEDACSGAAVPTCPEQGAIGGTGEQCGPPPVVAVTSSDELPQYPTGISTDAQQNPYNVYDMRTRYYRNSNMLMAPIAGPTTSTSTSGTSSAPTAAFFQLALPTSKVHVTFHCERIGAPCQIPDPNTANSNYVLLDHQISPLAPQRLPDGVTLLFALDGEYTFGAVTAMGLNETLGMGLVPWVAGNFTDFDIGGSDYTQGMIDGGDGNFA